MYKSSKMEEIKLVEETGQRVSKKRTVSVKTHGGANIEAQIFNELVSRYLAVGDVATCESMIESISGASQRCLETSTTCTCWT